MCSSLLRNFFKSEHKDGDHTQDHDSNWNISNPGPVIGRVNKIYIDNTFIGLYITYQYKNAFDMKYNYLHINSRGKAEHEMIEIIVEDLMRLKL